MGDHGLIVREAILSKRVATRLNCLSFEKQALHEMAVGHRDAFVERIF